MIKKYLPLTNIINEVKNNYPRVMDRWPLDTDLCIQWAIDCMQQIGTGVYEQKTFTSWVSGNKIRMPKDLHYVMGVYFSANNSDILDNNSKLYPIRYNNKNNSNWNYLCEDCIKDTINNGTLDINNSGKFQYSTYNDYMTTEVYSYEFYVNYPYLIFNFTDQKVCVYYDGFMIDSNDIPMYPEVVEVREAIKNYIIWNWMKEPFMFNEIPGNQFQYYEKQKDLYVTQARNYFKMPGVNDAIKQIDTQRKAFSRMRIIK